MLLSVQLVLFPSKVMLITAACYENRQLLMVPWVVHDIVPWVVHDIVPVFMKSHLGVLETHATQAVLLAGMEYLVSRPFS